ncbi:hypothetical protein NDU88_001820 [Pleurodeles waltl]|uniref:Uncharacterized protein n=1 Tax=Pleurodeles waltl TaxID=8319 RepID=A0AAV7QB75_PLEWA|nr:hypothetical protein NDU88_001820 [Pleurodeles waltl]
MRVCRSCSSESGSQERRRVSRGSACQPWQPQELLSALPACAEGCQTEGGAPHRNEETGRTDEGGRDGERETDGSERGIGRYAPLESDDLKGRREGLNEEVPGTDCHEDRPGAREKEGDERKGQVRKRVGGSTTDLKWEGGKEQGLYIEHGVAGYARY